MLCQSPRISWAPSGKGSVQPFRMGWGNTVYPQPGVWAWGMSLAINPEPSSTGSSQ
jgi:hypothetical protein